MRKEITKNNPISVWQWAMIGLNFIAIALSLYLVWQYYSGESMPGCGTGSSCDDVLNSRWSTVGGILPVSGLALSVYLGISVMLFSIVTNVDSSIKKLAWKLLLILTGAIAGSALFFISIQEWILNEFCAYCMALHSIGLLLAVLVIWRSFKDLRKYEDSSEESQKRASNLKNTKTLYYSIIVRVLIGFIASGILASYQFYSNPSETYHSDNRQNNLPRIDATTAPIIGSPEAPYIVTLLFDYQCSHCQKLHFMLEDVIKKYNGKLAFVLAPTPLERACNSYFPNPYGGFKNSCDFARIGLAVWLANPHAFETFENWLYSYDALNERQNQKLADARAKAIELVGAKKFKSALADPWISDYMQTTTSLFGKTMQNGRGGIPKMIYDEKWIIPQPYNADDLIRILKENFGLPEPL